MYCVKCKRNTDTLNLHHAVSKNNRNMLKGTCSVCGTTKNQFTAATTGGDFTNTINRFTSKIKLPWVKFPGEMHIPGMNFAGPGTNLDKNSLLLMPIKIGANLWTGWIMQLTTMISLTNTLTINKPEI